KLIAANEPGYYHEVEADKRKEQHNVAKQLWYEIMLIIIELDACLFKKRFERGLTTSKGCPKNREKKHKGENTGSHPEFDLGKIRTRFRGVSKGIHLHAMLIDWY